MCLLTHPVVFSHTVVRKTAQASPRDQLLSRPSPRGSGIHDATHSVPFWCSPPVRLPCPRTTGNCKGRQTGAFTCMPPHTSSCIEHTDNTVIDNGTTRQHQNTTPAPRQGNKRRRKPSVFEPEPKPVKLQIDSNKPTALNKLTLTYPPKQAIKIPRQATQTYTEIPTSPTAHTKNQTSSCATPPARHRPRRPNL